MELDLVFNLHNVSYTIIFQYKSRFSLLLSIQRVHMHSISMTQNTTVGLKRLACTASERPALTLLPFWIFFPNPSFSAQLPLSLFPQLPPTSFPSLCHVSFFPLVLSALRWLSSAPHFPMVCCHVLSPFSLIFSFEWHRYEF